jgi:hypothetical protein
MNEKLDFEIESCLKTMRDELQAQCAIFAKFPFPFDSAHSLCDYQENLSSIRSDLENGRSLGFTPVYSDCINQLEILEEKVYRFNPEGRLN